MLTANVWSPARLMKIADPAVESYHKQTSKRVNKKQTRSTAKAVWCSELSVLSCEQGLVFGVREQVDK